MTKSTRSTGRREGRGFITSFGKDRACSAPDCTTVLSRYNDATRCFIHDDDMRTNRVS